MSTPFLTLAALAMVALATAAPAQAAETSLPAPWTSRVLLVSAPGPADPFLREQRHAFASMGAGARERALVLVEAVGETPAADALRRRFGLDPALFQAVLVGKDGGAKLRSSEVLDAARLFPVIDAMPMRRQEMAQ